MRSAILLILAAAPLGAQTALSKIPSRQLGAVTATSTATLGSLAAVRQLPNGNVLVNDQARRRVLLMDSTLNLVRVVADSTSAESGYGARPGGLIAYRGDSTLFVDPASLSMLVIDPGGKVVRVMAAPRANDVAFLAGGPFGNPGFDAKGRLVYRAFARPNFGPGGPGVQPVMPDSEAIVRFDLATRKLDTAAFFRISRPRMTMDRDANGGIRMTSIANPLPLIDDWAVMSDGSIAFVRGRDYRVDFLNADGTMTKGEKIPYDWQRLSDEDKVAFIDSTKAAMTRARAAGGAAGGAAAPGNPLGGPGIGGGGQQVITMRMEGPPPGAGGGPGRDGPQIVTGGPPAGGSPPPINLVAPSELPDYKPVFGPGAVRADADGRLWIRTIPTKPTPGGAIYEVIDRSGKLIDRVQIPVGTAIAGFGAGGVVYLGVRDAAGIYVQRARYAAP